MARSFTIDLPEEVGNAWQAVAAADPQLHARLGVYAIRYGGQVLPVGSRRVGSPFGGDANFRGVRRQVVGDEAWGYKPLLDQITQVVVGKDSIGYLFIMAKSLDLGAVRERVAQRLALMHHTAAQESPDVVAVGSIHHPSDPGMPDQPRQADSA